MVQLTGIGPMFGQLTHFKLFAPTGNDYVLSRYQTEVRRLYDVLEQRLATSAYLGGADYGIVDMATYPWAANHQRQGVDFADKPNLARWLEGVAARPAVQRAIRKVDAMPTSRENAKADDVDRFFGRGRYARP
jgi:GST-like protein